jgi:hypothetical protein
VAKKERKLSPNEEAQRRGDELAGPLIRRTWIANQRRRSSGARAKFAALWSVFERPREQRKYSPNRKDDK